MIARSSTMITLRMPKIYKMEWLYSDGKIEKELFLMFVYVYTNHYLSCTKYHN